LRPPRHRSRFRARDLPAGRAAAGAHRGRGGRMSARPRIAVVGQPGAWSTERLAVALREAGAEAPIVDLAACALRLPEAGLYHEGRPLVVDAAVVKKIGDTAGATVRERLQMLRHLEAGGVPVWSAPDRIEAAVDRARMTLELVRARLPVPDTVITEDVGEA